MAREGRVRPNSDLIKGVAVVLGLLLVELVGPLVKQLKPKRFEGQTVARAIDLLVQIDAALFFYRSNYRLKPFVSRESRIIFN